MSKAVLLSIHSEWCEKIASGQKTIEVRKTYPKIETPVKCFIYQTKHKWLCSLLRSLGKEALAENLENALCKVIGEFVCDKIIPWEDDMTPPVPLADIGMIYPEVRKYRGLTETLYLWHISKLVIYDKQRELREFYKPGFSSIEDLDEDLCKYCYETDYGEKKCFSTPNGPVMCEGDYCESAYEAYLEDEGFTLTRPPQSWCYVEEL